MTPEGTPSYADRLFLASLRHPLSKPLAQRAVQKAARLLSLAFGQSLRELRDSPDPLMKTHSLAQEQGLLARVLAEVTQIIGARFDKLPERKRPHYTPHQRWRILEIRRLLAFSADETATLFRVSAGTILRWELEAGREPGKDSIGSLLKPTPPLRRYADVVRHTVQTMDRLGFTGAGKVASTLSRAGWRLARETVRRYKHQAPIAPTTKPRTAADRDGRPIKARASHDVWLIDLTHVKALFGLLRFRIAAVLDARSRAPLALRVFPSEPAAEDMAALVQTAARRHCLPRVVVSDHGAQFTAERFEKLLRDQGIQHRIGAIGKSGSIALIERFWRILKEELRLPIFRPLTQEDLERRVAYAALHYTFFRPHHALDGATPAEVLHGWPQAHLHAAQPPRGRAGDPSPPAPFAVTFLDPEARHPILVRAA
jgi:transposase InsO family protein